MSLWTVKKTPSVHWVTSALMLCIVTFWWESSSQLCKSSVTSEGRVRNLFEPGYFHILFSKVTAHDHFPLYSFSHSSKYLKIFPTVFPTLKGLSANWLFFQPTAQNPKLLNLQLNLTQNSSQQSMNEQIRKSVFFHNITQRTRVM